MPQKRQRQGIALVFYVLALFFFFGFMALATDVGYLYTQKANVQLISDTAALASLASLDYSQPHATQLAYITNQVNYFEQFHGLGVGYFTITTESAPNGNIIQVKLNAGHPSKTFFMALFGLDSLKVGIESIAVRGTIGYSYDPDCQNDGGMMGFFGCTHVEYQGNPMADSYLSDQGWYADQAVNNGCGSGAGGHHGHMGGGGHGGHGDGAKYARRYMGTGSNWRVEFTGNFCYHGQVRSGRDTDIGGNAGYLDGFVTTETFSGNQSLVSEGINFQSVPDTMLPTAVGAASAASNDNATVVGAKASDLASPNFALKPQGDNDIQLVAGKKYYFKDIKISGSKSIKIIGNPVTAGPVKITLDGDCDIQGDVKSDVVPTRPGWLQIRGIGGCTNCDPDDVVDNPGGHGGSSGGDGHVGWLPAVPGSNPLHGNPMVVGQLRSISGLGRLLGSVGVISTSGGGEVPAWQMPGAINLASGDDGGDDGHDGDGDSSDADHDHNGNDLPGGGGWGHLDGSQSHIGHVDCSTSRKIRISGNGDVYADIYAPGYRVTVTGCKNFFGRIVGEGLSFKGTTGIHFDESLGGCIRAREDANSSDVGRVHLIN